VLTSELPSSVDEVTTRVARMARISVRSRSLSVRLPGGFGSTMPPERTQGTDANVAPKLGVTGSSPTAVLFRAPAAVSVQLEAPGAAIQYNAGGHGYLRFVPLNAIEARTLAQ
jgi:hypothetical protein